MTDKNRFTWQADDVSWDDEPQDEQTIAKLFAEAAVKAITSVGDERAAERLRRYWAHGEGAAKIGWGTPGDFDRCVAELRKYVRNPEGFCAERHHDALGIWPATHAARERGHN